MESEPLPKWMMRRYAQLWKLFKDKEFNIEDAVKELREDRGVMLVLLSNWRKKGWLEVKFNKEDARKRVYRLKSPEKVIEVMC